MKNFSKTNSMICRIIFVMASAILMMSQAIASTNSKWEVSATNKIEITIEQETGFAGTPDQANFALTKRTGLTSNLPDIVIAATKGVVIDSNNSNKLVVTLASDLTYKQMIDIRDGYYKLVASTGHGLTNHNGEPEFYDAGPKLGTTVLGATYSGTVGEVIYFHDKITQRTDRQDQWQDEWELNNDYGGALGKEGDDAYNRHANAGELAAIEVHDKRKIYQELLKNTASNAQEKSTAKKQFDEALKKFKNDSNLISKTIYNLKFTVLTLQDEVIDQNLTPQEQDKKAADLDAAQRLLDKALEGSWEDRIYALEIDRKKALIDAKNGGDKGDIETAQKDYDDIIKAKKLYAVGKAGHPVHTWMEGVSNNQADDGLAKALTINYDLNMETRSVVSTFERDITKNRDDIAINKKKIEKNFKAIKANTASIKELSDDVDVIRSGVAASLAVAAMPVLTREGWGVAVGTGYFDGESAIAAGLTYSSNAYHLKFAVGHSGGHNAASAGATWAF